MSSTWMISGSSNAPRGGKGKVEVNITAMICSVDENQNMFAKNDIPADLKCDCNAF